LVRQSTLVALRKKKESELTTGSNKSFRTAENAMADMGMACTRMAERVAASVGRLESAQSQFEVSCDVTHGGAMFAIPAMLENGLLKNQFNLPAGFYDITHIFMTMGFMAVLRIKNLEQLRYTDPGEMGQLLGLDRCPEVRTLRNKLNLLTMNDDAVKAWQRELSVDWMEDNPELAGHLYIDGHVRTYFGCKANLPRRYVARQKLCLRGITDYWVNDMLGQPFFVISSALSLGMISMLRDSIVPRLLNDIPNQPSKTELNENENLHRFVLVFDREGYSPDFFKELWQERIACQTYHKYQGDDWPGEDFEELLVQMPGGEQVKMLLGEKDIVLSNGFSVREIRKLSKQGHQTSIVSSNYMAEMGQIAAHMFTRWTQENFFKYMRQEFGIDGLMGNSLAPTCETGEVVNPEYRKIDGAVRRQAAILGRLQRRYGQLSLTMAEETPKKTQRNEEQKATLFQHCMDAGDELARIKEERKNTTRKISANELSEDQLIRQIVPARKLFIDTIKMIAYRAETAMVALINDTMGHSGEARSLIRQLLQTEADFIPDEKAKTLTIRLHALTTSAANRTAQKLADELNSTETQYPGTDLRLHYELVTPPDP